MQFAILGPLEARRDGVPIALGGEKQRALLAFMLLHAGELVPAERLMDELWGDRPRAIASRALEAHLDSLRSALGGREALVARFPGYVLRVEEDALDLDRFERLAGAGRDSLAAGDAGAAAAQLAEALDVWRGPALADLHQERFAQAAAARLEELRLSTVEDRMDAELALGRHAEAVRELERLVASHPTRERLQGQRMLALHRSGRTAEALGAYDDARGALGASLGIEPPPALDRLAEAIQGDDPTLDLAGPRLPGGSVTLLFTDIEGSTLLLRELGESYAGVLATHRRIIRDAVAAHGGSEVDVLGDGFMCAFAHAEAAVMAAASAQRALAEHPWPDGHRVHVRMGVHTGEPTRTQEGYVGLDVHRAARICATARGDQIVLSAETRAALGGEAPESLDLRELGERALKDLPAPELLHELVVPGVTAELPPSRADGMLEANGEPDPGVGTRPRSILVLPHGRDGFRDLLAVAEPLARSISPHELILARIVPIDRSEALHDIATALNETRSGLVERGLPARSAAFTSADEAGDAVRLASQEKIDLMLTECPPGLVETGELDPGLATVLSDAPCDVAIVRAGAVTEAHAIVAPFGGGDHDWAALELAAWLASARSAPLRLLGTAADLSTGKRDASRLLAAASLAVQRLVGVACEPLLVEPGAAGVLDVSGDAAAIVAGIPSDWRQRALGASRLTVLREAQGTVLLVRRGLRPGGLAPAETHTRFTWSLAATPAS